MFLIFLFAAIAPHPGGAPTNWQPLSGIQHVNYRWSRPTSDSCLVEIVSAGRTSEPLHLLIRANVLNKRPDPPVEPMPGSPIYVEPTTIKPQTEEREFPIALSSHAQAIEDIHDCYGIVEAAAKMDSDHASADHQQQSEHEADRNR